MRASVAAVREAVAVTEVEQWVMVVDDLACRAAQRAAVGAEETMVAAVPRAAAKVAAVWHRAIGAAAHRSPWQRRWPEQ